MSFKEYSHKHWSGCDRRQVEGITLIISLSEHQGYFWAINDGFILRVYASDVGKMGDRQDFRRSDKGKFRPLARRPPSPITQKFLPNIYRNFNLKDVFSYFYFLPFHKLILCKQSQSIIFLLLLLFINVFIFIIFHLVGQKTLCWAKSDPWRLLGSAANILVSVIPQNTSRDLV